MGVIRWEQNVIIKRGHSVTGGLKMGVNVAAHTGHIFLGSAPPPGHAYTKSITRGYLEKYWTNFRLVCTHLNAIFMLNLSVFPTFFAKIGTFYPSSALLLGKLKSDSITLNVHDTYPLRSSFNRTHIFQPQSFITINIQGVITIYACRGEWMLWKTHFQKNTSP